MPDKMIALILYGNGAELGNFKFFADDLSTGLIGRKAFARTEITIKETLDRASVVDAIDKTPAGSLIKELHVFSHSIGGGLYVGYHEATAGMNRQAAAAAHPARSAKEKTGVITYEQALAAETGGVLSDHLMRPPLTTMRDRLRKKFATGATIKLWGCNSGVSGWVYSDAVDPEGRRYTADQNETATIYYWRALNTQNMPKPAIAQAIADYFNVPTYGAGSGSHIEVLHEGKWLTSTDYKKKTGRYAGEPQTLRLHPDAGDYNKFAPAAPMSAGRSAPRLVALLLAGLASVAVAGAAQAQSACPEPVYATRAAPAPPLHAAIAALDARRALKAITPEAIKTVDAAGDTPLLVALSTRRLLEPAGLGAPRAAAVKQETQAKASLARALIARGADAAQAGARGETPLIRLAQSDFPAAIESDLARLLLKRGAVVDARDTAGSTALIVAARRGKSGLAALLREAGADPSLVNCRGETGRP
ncbi:MAG: ankyrin repeat domain-containing protein [Rhizobiales bacterium]|nr:ankyrin repeat domain-containing protein [Hyphomicrobiales bacterium]